jgi:hypothetical protein
MLLTMGRDRQRVLFCAVASLLLILAAALGMDWYEVAFDGTANGLGKIAIAVDLRSVHNCTAVRVCTSVPLAPLPGMFPTLAAVTLWSSLAFAALVALQAGVRILTGNSNDSLAKFGYMFALTTMSIAFATAYLFGPEAQGPGIGMAAELGLSLQRTWAPLTLIVGQVLGFATLYMAVAPAPSELGDSYKPVTLVTVGPSDALDAPSDSLPPGTRAATRPLRPSGRPGTGADPNVSRPSSGALAKGSAGGLPLIGPTTITGEFELLRGARISDTQPAQTGVAERTTGQIPTTPRDRAGSVAGREPTGPVAARRAPTAPPAEKREPTPQRRETTGPASARRETSPPPRRESTALLGSRRETTPPQRETTPPQKRETTPPQKRETTPPQKRETTPPQKRETTPPQKREVTGQSRRETTGPLARRETTGPLAAPRETTGQHSKSGLLPIPDHLRNRLRYVALAAELTGGGIDARREDGSSRLVLWRDVVGVVARRLPPAYDGATFVDVVSTAGSTLRIVPWTRLTGDPIGGDTDERPRSVVEHIAARCPAAKLDPATRQFLETGTAAQLRDVETLHAHDARLA